MRVRWTRRQRQRSPFAYAVVVVACGGTDNMGEDEVPSPSRVEGRTRRVRAIQGRGGVIVLCGGPGARWVGMTRGRGTAVVAYGGNDGVSEGETRGRGASPSSVEGQEVGDDDARARCHCRRHGRRVWRDGWVRTRREEEARARRRRRRPVWRDGRGG